MWILDTSCECHHTAHAACDGSSVLLTSPATVQVKSFSIRNSSTHTVQYNRYEVWPFILLWIYKWAIREWNLPDQSPKVKNKHRYFPVQATFLFSPTLWSCPASVAFHNAWIRWCHSHLAHAFIPFPNLIYWHLSQTSNCWWITFSTAKV